jgi:hypothetical protein
VGTLEHLSPDLAEVVNRISKGTLSIGSVVMWPTGVSMTYMIDS